MMGMNMLMESMGLDATKLQANVESAVQHVAQINERIGKLELVLTNERLTNIESALSIVLNHSVATSATTMRIEDAVHQLATSSPDHSAGFVQEAAAQYPDAAQQMQQQIEEGISDGRTSEPEPGTSAGYVNGSGHTN